jgi:hypothetical protein
LVEPEWQAKIHDGVREEQHKEQCVHCGHRFTSPLPNVA